MLPPSRENFEIIREEAARLEHLVNDLRTLSLADAGELSMSIQTVEPERLINEVASLYQYETQKKNITLKLDIASPLPVIQVDPGRMTQVLTNILDNALRHTPRDGQIVLSAQQTEKDVEISVQDSGPGLPPRISSASSSASIGQIHRVSAGMGAQAWDLPSPDPSSRRMAGNCRLSPISSPPGNRGKA